MKKLTLRILAINHKLLLPIESNVSAYRFVAVLYTGSIGKLFRTWNTINVSVMGVTEPQLLLCGC